MRQGAAAGFLVVLVLAFAAAGRADDRQVARARALASYAAMQHYFYSPATALYDETYPASGLARAWPYSQALWATEEIARVGGAAADLRARLAALSAYSRGSAYAPIVGGRGDPFYDDNLWIALGLLAVADHEGPAMLAQVQDVFTLVDSAWDRDARHPCPGGVFWTAAASNRDRNAVTTANAALLALRLYERTHSAHYLAWAKRAFGWAQGCLGLPGGLLADHIALGGGVDQSTWSYNQGAMIAAAVHLYLATRERRYLEDAKRRADATLRKLGDPLASGEPPAFLAIFYRDLLELTRVDPARNDRAELRAFADEAWSRARDPKTGLFHFGRGSVTLLDQAAMVQVYAEVAAA